MTVVNVALPSIAQDFKTSFSELQWVIDTYALVLAALILTMAKIGDLFGRKRLFLVGLFIFSSASLGCALSQNVTQLQIARALQGVGGAILSPIAAAIISATFWGPELGTAFGIYGGVSGIALVAGPIIGGLLVKYVNWQSVFLVNVPIGLIGIVAGAILIKESRNPRARRYVDIAGRAPQYRHPLFADPRAHQGRGVGLDERQDARLVRGVGSPLCPLHRRGDRAGASRAGRDDGPLALPHPDLQRNGDHHGDRQFRVRRAAAHHGAALPECAGI